MAVGYEYYRLPNGRLVYSTVMLGVAADGVTPQPIPVSADGYLPVRSEMRDAQYTPAACSGGTTTGATPGTVLTLCAAGEVTIGGVVMNPSTASASLLIDITGTDPAISPGGTTFEIPPGGSFPLVRSSAAVKILSSAASHVFSAWRT